MSPLRCRPNETLSVRVMDASCISQQIICWYGLMDGCTHTHTHAESRAQAGADCEVQVLQ